MAEYGAGRGAYYMTNEPTLNRGLELLNYMRVDLDRMAARDLHDLLRSWEVRDRYWCAQAHLRHILFRKETRWLGYYRGDYPRLDDQNWGCFVNSRYDAERRVAPDKETLHSPRRVTSGAPARRLADVSAPRFAREVEQKSSGRAAPCRKHWGRSNRK